MLAAPALRLRLPLALAASGAAAVALGLRLLVSPVGSATSPDLFLQIMPEQVPIRVPADRATAGIGGSTLRGSEVWIDWTPVPVDEVGLFSAQVPVAPGCRDVEVVASHPSGDVVRTAVPVCRA